MGLVTMQYQHYAFKPWDIGNYMFNIHIPYIDLKKCIQMIPIYMEYYILDLSLIVREIRYLDLFFFTSSHICRLFPIIICLPNTLNDSSQYQYLFGMI